MKTRFSQLSISHIGALYFDSFTHQLEDEKTYSFIREGKKEVRLTAEQL